MFGQTQSMAGGGMLDPSIPTLVGEAGPELIVNNEVIPLQGLQTAQTGGAFMSQPAVQPPPPQDPMLAAMQPQQSADMGTDNAAAAGPPQMETGGADPSPPIDIQGVDTGTGVDPNAPNAGQFPASANQGMGTGWLQQLLQQNPEQQAFNTGMDLLNNQFFGQNPGQGVMDALQPVFQQNLDYGLGQLSNRAPSVSNSAMRMEGQDLTQRALNDFNLMGSQAMLQGQQNQLGGLGAMQGLAGQAGMNPFNRALGAGGLANQGMQIGNQHQQAMMNLAQQQQQFQSQFGLAQNQQWFNQNVMPSLQLLMSMLPMLGPTGYQTVAMGG
jgi:hypothetical protein